MPDSIGRQDLLQELVCATWGSVFVARLSSLEAERGARREDFHGAIASMSAGSLLTVMTALSYRIYAPGTAQYEHSRMADYVGSDTCDA